MELSEHSMQRILMEDMETVHTSSPMYQLEFSLMAAYRLAAKEDGK